MGHFQIGKSLYMAVESNFPLTAFHYMVSLISEKNVPLIKFYFNCLFTE